MKKLEVWHVVLAFLAFQLLKPKPPPQPSVEVEVGEITIEGYS